MISRLIKIKEWVDKNDPGAILIPFSGAFENKLLDMNEAERGKYLEEGKVTRWIRDWTSFPVILLWWDQGERECEKREERNRERREHVRKKLNVSP